MTDINGWNEERGRTCIGCLKTKVKKTFKGKCGYCGKYHHKAADCYKRKTNQKYGHKAGDFCYKRKQIKKVES